ncbi:putative aldehdye dehydrogenase [Aspergillus nomiae NRRL 13137]|uniref:aldehyde dehydrogenase (NAD(+)) n=1 Tax=Aspergillus nomiae NRRL (strain ATCC 15546 / NRRL 13137 / CBS 260.88 / M93) TaxID=1509407 RepID=A0A0L1J307_ASPN3|nr:putative aldehdye dehydrogenase [Aspergillus nomiae NRRL 13137]KNG86134.1 putative aldehdye dehydrogenase [Aspergillus nomiae NRRL 13137]
MSTTHSLPSHLDLFYNGQWYRPKDGVYAETFNPACGQPITKVAVASAADVDEAVNAAHQAFLSWRTTPPVERARCLRRAADLLREHADELAWIDSLNTGNPLGKMLSDAKVAATSLDYFAGLIPMLKGETIPQSDDTFHYTVREPLGVVGRIMAFNHPIQFTGSKIAAPLAAGNTVVVKTPDQAPLSCLRLAEILGPVFPPGVLNILPGQIECGKALTTHPLVKKITLIGSVPTGRAIQQAAAATLKPTLLELGGKNALLAFPDADVDALAEGVARGMNYTWAGQSCGSTSRVFLHESHYETVIEKVKSFIEREFKPGVPTDMSTTMGPLINKAAQERVLSYILSADAEGARLITGGKIPKHLPGMELGYWVEPTVYADVQPHMRIAKEEIFGPIMSIFKWSDEEELIKTVNDTAYGLTASVFTRDISRATRIVRHIEAGYIWINQVSKHFIGVPFGGAKQSGVGKEECLEELLSFTEIKSVNVLL